MDVILSLFVWPLVTLWHYLRFILSIITCLPYLLYSLARMKSPLADFQKMHASLKCFPLGIYLFSGLVGMYSPYQASVYPVVEDLTDDGLCVISMKDYPWVRNPFSCVHAAALTNLGEACGGIAAFSAFQKNKHLKGIPVKLTTTFIAKARGKITGKARVDLSSINSECERELITNLYNSKNELVCTVAVTWRISVKSPKTGSGGGSKLPHKRE